MNARHPSRQRLQRWLETGEPRRVDKHIDDCEQCQGALEELSALDEGLVADLQAATTPPEDLQARTHGGVDVRLRNEAAFGAFLDLFTIGWDVARSILDPDSFDIDAGLEEERDAHTQREEPHGQQRPADQATGDSA